MRHALGLLSLGLFLSAAAGCAVRHVPIEPALEPLVDDDTPRLPEQVVALVMDPTVASFRRDRDFSLFQQERYSSGEHFMRSLLAQLRARGLVVLEVESVQRAQELGAPFVLIPDVPGVSAIRPKGLLDFSFLGSLNRIGVSYSVRLLKKDARVPERVSGSGTRTASFFWSNAMVQSVCLSIIGSSASFVIYGAWMAYVVAQAAQNKDPPSNNPRDVIEHLAPPPHMAVAVFIVDHLLSQAIAQMVPRVINPLVDVLINEPRWQVMVQGAHDSAVEDLADQLVMRIGVLSRPPVPGSTRTAPAQGKPEGAHP